ncbi:ABC-2 transporter permease [Lysinibacillus sp. NPDC093688]|uniref:ABC-2 transporter permease n=1 Tax=Lysinibacillus sp. NPDC093688 TaxID=3390577 RepID=UPI003CFFD85E
MFNLVLKDILIQKKLIPFYLATIILYLLIDASLVKIGIIYSLVSIMNAFSYDEKDNANILLNSLPYTRKEVVNSKYIGALIFTSIFIIFTYVSNFLLNREEAMFLWQDILLIIGLVMVGVSFMFPFSYKFKSQYLLMALIALFGIYMLTIKIFPNFNNILGDLISKFITLQETQMYLVAILTIVILYIGSWLLSIRIYERKAF